MIIPKIKEGKIGERPSWDEYFMFLAIVASTRASCHRVRAGSVIVQDKMIIGTGYNGAPNRIKNCLEAGCRKELSGISVDGQLNSGNCIGVHSEMNALAHLTKIANKEATIYNTIFSCAACAKNLISYNIKRIVFKESYDSREFEIAKKLFEEAGIIVEQLNLSPERIMDILFNRKCVNFDIFSKEEKEKIKDKLINNFSLKNNPSSDEIKLGKYRHFKGQLYELMNIAKHSETQEEMAVYRALYGDNSLWIRPKNMFFETIVRDGKEIKRFEYAGE